MVVPIQALRSGAALIGSGDLGQRITIKSGDEVEALADQFNDMAGKLQESYADLEKKVDQRTAELSVSLEQQTAISEILRVISNSPNDVQPVLDAVAEHAARICEAQYTDIFIVQGDALRIVSGFGEIGRPVDEPFPLDRSTIAGRTVVDRQPVHVEDVQQTGNEFALGQVYAQKFGHRTILGVPLIREGRALGAIVIRRTEVRPFEQKHIALLSTFADQAAIAIENVRLFEAEQQRTHELAESLEQQTATAEVLKIISRSLDLQSVLNTLVESIARMCDADMATIRRPKGMSFLHVATHGVPHEFSESMKDRPVEPDRGTVAGRVLLEGKPIHIADVQADPNCTMTEIIQRTGFHTILGVPLLREGNPIGVIILGRTEVRPFSAKQIELANTFADQAVIAVENVRLFEEIQEKSRQVEEASKHKSQFLANMSHELRTPLNAILGYTELVLDGIYGEAPDKMRGVLERIQTNGKHLLGLINDVLDLSKIEAGQLVLSLNDYSVKDMMQGVFVAVEPLAATRSSTSSSKCRPLFPPRMVTNGGCRKCCSTWSATRSSSPIPARLR
jgi:GAF domain-containing protein